MKRLFPLVAAFTLAALLLTSGLFSQSVAQLPPAGSPPSASQKGRQQPLPSPTAETAPPTADIPDPLLDVPPLPKGKVTLVGGTVANIDRIRDRLAIQPFGGGSKMKVFFDERTHIYRDGVEITQAKINKGDRIYVDTMLDGARVFARTIRILTQFGPADARGQLQSFDPRNGNIYMRDELSSRAISFRLTPATAIKQNNQLATQAQLRPGALIAVKFSPDRSTRGLATEISILALPGTNFVFSGKITYVDMRSHLLAVANQTDSKTYDIHFDPSRTIEAGQLTVGAEVTIDTVFNGSGYEATKIVVNQPGAAE